MKAILNIWTDAKNINTIEAYFVALWITSLGALFAISFTAMLFKLVTNPAAFSGLEFGLFETLGN